MSCMKSNEDRGVAPEWSGGAIVGLAVGCDPLQIGDGRSELPLNAISSTAPSSVSTTLSPIGGAGPAGIESHLGVLDEHRDIDFMPYYHFGLMGTSFIVRQLVGERTALDARDSDHQEAPN